MIASRFRALALHFLASIAVVGAAIAAMHAAWYPAPLASLQGWFDLLWVVIGVDLVLGPCLTFVVYAPGKKSLRFDLAAIVLIQLAALGYGVYTSANGRPVYLVFMKDRFETVMAAEYPQEELVAAKDSPFVKFSWLGPQVVTAAMPPQEATRIIFSAIAGGGLRIMPRYYQPYATATQAAIAAGKTLADIRKAKPQQAKAIEEWIQDAKTSADTVVFVPLKAKLGYGLIMLDAKSGKIIGMKDIDPSWY